MANGIGEVEVDLTSAYSQAKARPRTSIKTRLGALVTLCCFVFLLFTVVRTAYLAATDSFVAPIIFSPDNDIVLAHRQKVMELEVERAVAQAQLEGLDADLSAMDTAEKRLSGMMHLSSQSIAFTSQVTSQQASAGTVDISSINEQRQLLQTMYQRQKENTQRAKQNYDAGLLTQADYDRELTALHQAELALLENSRARARADAEMGKVMLSRSAIERKGALMPEQVQRETQMIQVQLELLRLGAEKRSKQAEKRVLTEKISKIVDLQTQLKSRPIFQAIERSLYAAFVPYNQMKGVTSGVAVYQCVWGIFACTHVGRVAEVVPGEVNMPDPFGNASRGQYILLDLTDPKAATSKVLRVRGSERV